MTLCPHHWKIGGVSLNSKLWTAKILAEQPELIKQVHKNYFKAGADCGITCSYQASIPGLMENGYTLEEAENLIRSAVKIFCEARDEWWEEEGREAGRAWPLCLGAAGPYGAYLADGSEYRGNYGITDEQLKEFGTDVRVVMKNGIDMKRIYAAIVFFMCSASLTTMSGCSGDDLRFLYVVHC